MKRKTLFSYVILFLAVGVLMHCKTSSSTTMRPVTSELPKLWKKVDSLEQKRLPQSALEVLAEINELAMSSASWPDYIKSVLLINKLKQEPKAWTLSQSIQDIEHRLDGLPAAPRAILHSYLGELYSAYLRLNYWKIQDQQDGNSANLEEMSIAQLQHQANQYFLSSLEHQEISESSWDDFELLWINQEELRPGWNTLYDVLAYRAVKHLSSHDPQLQPPFGDFLLENPDYLGTSQEFTQMTLSKIPQMDPGYQALLLFQELLQNYPSSSSLRVEFDLMRLKLVYERGVFADKGRLYEKALNSIIENYPEAPSVTLAYAQLADYWLQQSREDAPLARRQARELCLRGSELHPESVGAQICQSKVRQIEAKQISIQVEQVSLPGQKSLVMVQYQNIPKIFVQVVRMSMKDQAELPFLKFEEQLPWLLAKPTVFTSAFDLNLPADYHQHQTEIPIDALPSGYYYCLVGTDSSFSQNNAAVASAGFFVSKLSYHHYQEAGNHKIFVVDRASGSPLEGVEVQWLQRVFDQGQRRQVIRVAEKVATNAEGFARLPETNGKNFQVRLRHQGDWILLDHYLNDYGSFDRAQPYSNVKFFTDRAIYRPGQKLFFKAISMLYGKDNLPQVEVAKEIKVSLYDANGQEVEHRVFTTNSFGSINGHFNIPTSSLAGQFSLGAKRNRHRISVEAYKRPSFEVLIDPLEGSQILGDSVTVTGTVVSFAGVPVRNVPVTFRTTREMIWMYRPHFFGRSYFPTSPAKQICAGQVTTDSNGNFRYRFKAQPDMRIDRSGNPTFRFNQEISVVDVSGETQFGTASITLGFQPYQVSVLGERDRAVGTSDSLLIKAANLNGAGVEVSGQIIIEKLADPVPLRDRYWTMPDQPLLTPEQYESFFPDYTAAEAVQREPQVVQSFPPISFAGSGEFEVQLPVMRSLARGLYRIKILSNDVEGHEATTEHVVHLYDVNVKELSTPDLTFHSPVKSKYTPGDTIEISLISHAERILYTIHRSHSQSETKWLEFGDGWSHLKIPVQQEDRGGMKIELATAFNNRATTNSIDIEVPWSNKNLDVHFTSWRDFIKPGSQEEISLAIAAPDDQVQPVELLATMYDASLETFRKHVWDHHFYPTRFLPAAWRLTSYHAASGTLYAQNWPLPYTHVNIAYPNLNFFGVHQPIYRARNFRNVEMAMEDRIEGVPATPTAKETVQSSVRNEMEAGSNEVEAPSQVREDLAETTFFYPDIQVSKEGNVNINFKANDALTTWKIKAFAHRPDLAAGVAELEIVSRKELMLTPNLPRFLRSGDEIQLSTKLDNLTDQPIHGKIGIVLRSMIDDRLLSEFIHDSNEKTFDLARETAAQFTWTLILPPDFAEPMSFEITAVGENHSDAIRMAIPVMINREYITETKVIQVGGNESKKIVFEPLAQNTSKSLTTERYLVEYSSNPIWYAIKAMPYLMDYPHECTEQVFNRYLANSLGRQIIESNPTIEKVFEQWRQEGSLQSALTGKDDLKGVTIAETPWVRDAQSEVQQQQNLALFFDANNLNQALHTNLQKLTTYQAPNGGFPWFPGGKTNWYITQYVLEGFGRMQRRGNTIPEILVSKGLDFVHGRALEAYLRIKKRVGSDENKWNEDHLSSIMVHYLYTLSHFPHRPIPDENLVVKEFLMSQIRTHWNHRSLFDQVMIGLVALREGDASLAADILASIKERAVQDPSLGMYWNQDAGVRWSQRPIETHALIMHFFDEAGESEQSLDALKVWLLNQKRTTSWPTTKATAEAVEALVLYGNDWTKAVPVALSIGGKNIPKPIDTRGELYVKAEYTGEEVRQTLADIAINNPNTGTTWGAVYWQYFEETEKVKASTGEILDLKRELLLEQITPQGEVKYRPLDEDDIEVGDKVTVQLLIEVDRDLEFVHLKDFRAAGFEPRNVISNYRYRGGLGYYQSTLDNATHFFIDYLPRGRHVLQYELTVNQMGDFSTGIGSIQSMYAPEFSAHTAGRRVQVRPRG